MYPNVITLTAQIKFLFFNLLSVGLIVLSYSTVMFTFDFFTDLITLKYSLRSKYDLIILHFTIVSSFTVS